MKPVKRMRLKKTRPIKNKLKQFIQPSGAGLYGYQVDPLRLIQPTGMLFFT